MASRKVVVAGLGGIGRAVALIFLQARDELGLGDLELCLTDIHQASIASAREWLTIGHGPLTDVSEFDSNEEEQWKSNLGPGSLLLDCTPSPQTLATASRALEHGSNYVNITEHVDVTQKIRERAHETGGTFVLQTGLAPGFINVLGAQLVATFADTYKDRCIWPLESLYLRVGALSDTASAPHFYAFTWSAIGVATEYLHPAVVLRDGKRTKTESLQDVDRVVIRGVEYEEALTSGGAADLPEILEGKVSNLEYRTLRYPGHYEYIKNARKSIDSGQDRSALARDLEALLIENIPFDDEDDLVVAQAVVTGKVSREGSSRTQVQHDLKRIESTFVVHPQRVGNQLLRAIQSTTAAAMVECALMVLNGSLVGVVTPGSMTLEQCRTFLTGRAVSQHYQVAYATRHAVPHFTQVQNALTPV